MTLSLKDAEDSNRPILRSLHLFSHKVLQNGSITTRSFCYYDYFATYVRLKDIP